MRVFAADVLCSANHIIGNGLADFIFVVLFLGDHGTINCTFVITPAAIFAQKVVMNKFWSSFLAKCPHFGLVLIDSSIVQKVKTDGPMRLAIAVLLFPLSGDFFGELLHDVILPI